jgi:hypothetical protein
MTMLMHARGPFKPAHTSLGRQDTVDAGAVEARLAMIRRCCRCAVTILLAGSTLAGIIALKAAIFLSRLNH